MARITSVHGMYNSVPTYEHICDTTTDMMNIKNEYRTYGSICIIISGGAGNIEIYTADSNNNWISIGTISGNPTTNELKKMINAIVENSSDTVDIVHTAEEYAEASEAWAVGTRNGTPIGETDLAYENNAKKYALDSEAWATGYRGGTKITNNEDPAFENNAKKYAMDAGGSAVAAMSLTKDAEAWANGTQNGQTIPSTHPAFEKNARYWSNHAFSATPEGYEDLVDGVVELKNSVNRMKADKNDIISIATNMDRLDADLMSVRNNVGRHEEELIDVQDEIKTKANINEIAALNVEADECRKKIDALENKLSTKANVNEVVNEMTSLNIEADHAHKRIDDLKNEVGKISVNAGQVMDMFIQNENMSERIQTNATGLETQQSQIAVLNTALRGKISKPNEDGNQGQVLSADGNGGVEWADPFQPNSEQIGEAVSEWMDNNPDATTTVTDRSITMQKLSLDVQNAIQDNAGTIDNTVLNGMIYQVQDVQKYINNESYQHVQMYEQLKQKLIQYAALYGNNDGIGFIFFTDPHNSNRHYGESPYEMLEGLRLIRTSFENSPASYVVCGGDWLNYGQEYDEALMATGRVRNLCRTEIGDKCYNILGNHDFNMSSNSASQIDELTVHKLWFDSDVGYYTVDSRTTTAFMFDSGQDTMGQTNYKLNQVKWFADILMNNMKPHLFGFIHIVHTPSYVSQHGTDWIAENITATANAFNRRESIIIGQQEYNFTSAAGTFHFLMCGHYHSDHLFKRNNIPVAMTEGFLHMNSFDFCYANFDTAKLNMIRFGSGSSRTMNIIPNNGYETT